MIPSTSTLTAVTTGAVKPVRDRSLVAGAPVVMAALWQSRGRRCHDTTASTLPPCASAESSSRWPWWPAPLVSACGGGDDDESDDATPARARARARARPRPPAARPRSTSPARPATCCRPRRSPTWSGRRSRRAPRRPARPPAAATSARARTRRTTPTTRPTRRPITLYPNLDAADQGRGEDAQPIKGLGDQAYASTFGSVWVYVDDISLFTQWYSFDGTDEENLPKSKALAKAVVDELAEVGWTREVSARRDGVAPVTEAATTYRLVRPSLTGEPPVLDEQQQRVADHDGGPLLVLAGPGTGKTTTLVEAIVRRIEEGTHPDRILALTFSRKAAEQLRDRVTARVGRTMSASIGSTFHSFAYGLIRRYAPAELYVGPLRLLSAPEQDVVLRELLQDHPESIRWPDDLRHALGTRGFAREVHAVLSRAREKGLDGEELQRLGEANGLPEFVAAGAFLEQYLTILDERGAVDYSDLIRRATIEATLHRDELRAALRARLRRRVPRHRLRAGRAAAGDRRRRPRPGRGRRPAPVDLRVPRRRGARHPRLPDRLPASRRLAGRGGRARHHPPVRATDPHRRAAGRRPDRAARQHPRDCPRGVPRTRPRTSASTARAGSWSAPSTATAARPSTWPTCSGGRTSRTASRGTRWRCWSAPAASPSRRCAAPSAPPGSRSRSPATRCRWSATRPRCR